MKGDVRTVVALDVRVALGRPRGERYSCHQWRAEGVAPQIVLEVVSPSSSVSERAAKLAFYERSGDKLALAAPAPGAWSSPLLGISFRREAGERAAYHPDGSTFLRFAELMEQRELDQLRFDVEHAVQSAPCQKLPPRAAAPRKPRPRSSAAGLCCAMQERMMRPHEPCIFSNRVP